MGVREVLKTIELRAVRLGDIEFCPHEPPEIHYPDGSVENVSEHECGMPRLKFVVSFVDGSDAGTRTRQLKAARLRFQESAAFFPNEPEDVRRATIAHAFGVSEEDLL